MRNASRCFLVAILVAGLIGFVNTGFAGAEGKPTLVVVTPEVDMSKKQTEVKLKGTGFEPGATVMILFVDDEGVTQDVGWALEPEPKADAKGEWATTFDAKRYMEKKLIKAGEYNIAVADADYNELDAKTVKFVGKLPKKKKK